MPLPDGAKVLAGTRDVVQGAEVMIIAADDDIPTKYWEAIGWVAPEDRTNPQRGDRFVPTVTSMTPGAPGASGGRRAQL